MKPQLTFFTIITAPASISSQKLPLKTILNTISSSENPSWVNDDNATLLDIFGEIAKDVITNQMIPETEASCDWNWMHLRCEPFCTCSYQPLWGDYHLGRSCRAREVDADDSNDGQDFLNGCNSPPNTIFYNSMKCLRDGIQYIRGRINWRRSIHVARNSVCNSLPFDDPRVLHEAQNGDINSSSKHFMEIPVRAMRRSLDCDHLKVQIDIHQDDDE